jgi:hypothetical protein
VPLTRHINVALGSRGARKKRSHPRLSSDAAIAAVAAEYLVFGPLGFARIDLIGKRLLLRCIKLRGLTIEALHGIQKIEIRKIEIRHRSVSLAAARPRNRNLQRVILLQQHPRSSIAQIADLRLDVPLERDLAVAGVDRRVDGDLFQLVAEGVGGKVCGFIGK